MSINDLQTRKLELLASYVKIEMERGEKLKFSENIVYYIFQFGEATIKISKNERTLVFKFKNGEFCTPITVTQQQIDDLIKSAEEENKE